MMPNKVWYCAKMVTGKRNYLNPKMNWNLKLAVHPYLKIMKIPFNNSWSRIQINTFKK